MCGLTSNHAVVLLAAGQRPLMAATAARLGCTGPFSLAMER